MNSKKLMTFGVLGLFAIALVTAGLVDYLSNTVNSQVTVESPLALQVSVGNGWQNSPVVISNALGGGTFTYWLQAKNKGNVPIDTDMTTVITNADNNVTCADFTKMNITVTKNTHDPSRVGESQDVLSLCSDARGIATIVIPSNYQDSEKEEYKIDTTFAVNVKPSTYQIDTQARI